MVSNQWLENEILNGRSESGAAIFLCAYGFAVELAAACFGVTIVWNWLFNVGGSKFKVRVIKSVL